jgi:hypothetical protein
MIGSVEMLPKDYDGGGYIWMADDGARRHRLNRGMRSFAISGDGPN